MSEAPKRGRGRPRKHATAEDARLAKLTYDRVRFLKLTTTEPTVESDPDERAIAASTPACMGPTTTIPTDPSGPSSPSSPSSPTVPIQDPIPPIFEDESL